MKRPNIILFVAEDLDYEGINCFDAAATGFTGLYRAGNPYAVAHEPPTRGLLTPTLDAIAGAGAMFGSYYCASPICTPARYSILTGRFPERSPELMQNAAGKPATVWFNTPILPEETLLPKSLKSVGYHTALFGKWHNFPTPVGSEIYNAYTSFPASLTWESPVAREAVRRGYRLAADYLRGESFGWDVAERIYYDNPEILRPEELSSQNIDWVVEGAADFLRAQKGREDPFFAYIAVSLPHSRYSGERFLSANPRSSPAGLLDEPPTLLPSREVIRARVQAAGLPDSACEALWLDEAVKAVLAALRESGRDGDTCFVFTTDHPTAGKGSCHLGRIPLIFYWPGRIAPLPPQRQLLSEVDLAPTLLELAGCPAPADMSRDGRSFWPLLGGGTFRAREDVLLEVVNSRALVSGGFKYIANRLPGRTREELRAFLAAGPASANRFPHPDWDEPTAWRAVGWFAVPERDYMYWHLDELFPAYFAADQLYDLRADPLEQHNLAGDPRFAQTLAALRHTLRLRLADLPGPFAV